jgi:HD-GYP domain-containing protein (c-di-GMP phosphodiesterase class II)/pSer/pThr/pTyr-binding forkhead associated (FHA) protein
MVCAVKQLIRLRGISDDVKGKVWESESVMRAGRLGSLEIVLDDSSVSRRHAEVRFQNPSGWVVKDLESTNGTYVNGVRIGPQEKVVRVRDIVQFGKVAMIVESTDTTTPAAEASGGLDKILVEASANSSWEDLLQGFVFDRNRGLRPGEQLLAMIRAGHHLVHVEREEDLLQFILNDAVQVLDAQRGAIVLAEGPEGKLKLRALASAKGEASQGRFHYSQKLAQRCFLRGESLLCCSVADDPELAAAQSIADGLMASVLCVLLRTPRNRLGILHLDRAYWQKPFSEDDLHLADALAANVSAGIEAAQLLRRQKDLFLNTITVLAQAVELKDKYTHGHTKRVTEYAVLLGKQLGLAKEDMDRIEIGTPLHDIGKIFVDDAILRKPDKLTPDEWEQMKAHTTKGAAIIGSVPDLATIIPIVRNHHERWDGNGYPDKLQGENTHQLARIVAVVDAFDAMTSDRPYHMNQRSRTPEEAFAELQTKSGTQFDPQAAAAFCELQDQIIEIMRGDRQTTRVPPAAG